MDDGMADCAGARVFIEVDDLPDLLRTCVALGPAVQVTLPGHVALQLARRIEDGRPKPRAVVLEELKELARARAALRLHMLALLLGLMTLLVVVAVLP